MTRRRTLIGSFTALALLVVAAQAGDAPPAAAKADSSKAAASAATDLFKRGLEAREKGDEARARDLFQKAIASDSEHAGARRALGQVRHADRWVELKEAMRIKGLVQRDGQWILREEAEILDLPEKLKVLRREEQKKLYKLLRTYADGNERVRRLARASIDTVDAKYKLEPFAYALRSKSEALRVLAAQELGRLKNRRGIRPLLKRSVADPSETVRHAAIDAAKAIGDPNLILPLVKALQSEDARTRMRAADGISRIGDVRGVQYLVWRFEAHGAGVARVYSAFAAQLTFIQDFDVEVAQTAFIADPIVGVIQEGIVLDAEVVATSIVSHFVEREAIHGALTRLTRADDIQNKKGAWATWYRDHKDELIARHEAATKPAMK